MFTIRAAFFAIVTACLLFAISDIAIAQTAGLDSIDLTRTVLYKKE